MSVAKIYSDQSRRIDWTVRKGTDATISVVVTQSAVAYDLSTYTFIAEIFKSGSTTAILTLTQGSGITNGGVTGIVGLTLTDANLALLGDQYFWKLRTTSPTDNLWFNGQFVVNDYLWDGGTDTTVAVDLTIGNNTINVNLTLVTGGSGTLEPTNWAGTVTLPTDKPLGSLIKFDFECVVPYLGGVRTYPPGSLALALATNSGSAANWYPIAMG